MSEVADIGVANLEGVNSDLKAELTNWQQSQGGKEQVAYDHGAKVKSLLDQASSGWGAVVEVKSKPDEQVDQYANVRPVAGDHWLIESRLGKTLFQRGNFTLGVIPARGLIEIIGKGLKGVPGAVARIPVEEVVSIKFKV